MRTWMRSACPTGFRLTLCTRNTIPSASRERCAGLRVRSDPWPAILGTQVSTLKGETWGARWRDPSPIGELHSWCCRPGLIKGRVHGDYGCDGHCQIDQAGQNSNADRDANCVGEGERK